MKPEDREPEPEVTVDIEIWIADNEQFVFRLHSVSHFDFCDKTEIFKE